MKHPGEMELALFAGNDLGFLARWRVAVHLRTCADCRYEVEGLKFDAIACANSRTNFRPR